MSNITATLNWMQARLGKVYYSMAARMGPNSYDCSSAVFFALQAGGFRIPFVGNTETLFSMRGGLLTPINRSQIQAGDIFVSGVPGGSNNAYGHTGFALNATQAIHCSSTFNGIGISSNADSSVRAYGGAPVYWFRVSGATPAPVDPEAPSEEDILITDVNDGKEYLAHDELVKLFGVRMETVRFDDVMSATDLKQKAKDYLDAQPLDLYSLSADIIQLSELNKPSEKQYKKLREGDIVTVRNDELNINQRMRIETVQFDASGAGRHEIDLGRHGNKLERLIAGQGGTNGRV